MKIHTSIANGILSNQHNAKTPLLTLNTLTAAALVLPGLLPAITHAAEDDSVDFQYSHYQEGKRDLGGNTVSQLNPIEVEGLHGSGKFSLTDRIKFAFNYTQDTWQCR
jgi:hypothetical protein